MSVINDFSKEAYKGIKEIKKVSTEIIENTKTQNELRVLRRKKDYAFKELGKRVFVFMNEREELKKEDFMDIFYQIENIEQVISNIKTEQNMRKKSEEEDVSIVI